MFNMNTINISMPNTLTEQVDRIIEQEGYASRSEFFRTLLRFYLGLRPQATSEEKLGTYNARPLEEVASELRDGGYSDAFVESVILGLKKSSVYGGQDEDKTTA